MQCPTVPVPEVEGETEAGRVAGQLGGAQDAARRGERPHAGTNCIKIGLPGKLILSKRKVLLEDLFS